MKNNNQYSSDLLVQKKSILLLIILLCGLLSPFIILNITPKGPPLNFPEKNRTQVGDFCGFCHAGYSTSESEYSILKNLGVHWMRVDFSWEKIERGNDNWNFTYWDNYVGNATNHGVKILAILDYSASWLNLSTNRCIPPDYVHYFLDYVNKTVRRYKDNVSAWEIWNEPNEPKFWDGPMEYFHNLFNQTANLIHNIDPDIYIVGTSMFSAVAGYLPPETEEMFKAGIMTHIDAISIHFYNYDADKLYQGIMQYLIIGKKYGFTGDYWITELGNPTGGTYPWRVSMDKLAENVIKSYVIASTLQIKTFIWYCMKDSGDETSDPRNSEYFFGLLFANYSWKKGAYAYSLFSKYCSNSEFCPDLIQKNVGIAASDLMAALYRRVDGISTLVMWYDPTLYESGSVKVTLDLSAITGTTLIHNIYSGANQSLDDNFIEIGNVPIFLTFQAKDLSDPVILYVEESIPAVVIFITVFGIFIMSISLAVIIYRRYSANSSNRH